MAKLLQDVLDRLKTVENNIEIIERGVYGDSENEVKGLVQSVRELQCSVKKLQEQLNDENRKLNDKWVKAISFLSGAGAVIAIIWAIFKWITSH